MSEKLECPGCGSYSSSVLFAAAAGSPCPYCGLSAAAVTEVTDLRAARADEGLKQRLAQAVVELDRVRSERDVLRGVLDTIRSTVEEVP